MTAATNQNTSLELANALLMKAREASIPVSASTLQQLVYLASGWNLAINSRPLILDQPEAARSIAGCFRRCNAMATSRYRNWCSSATTCQSRNRKRACRP
jgi:hypothetical protein